MFTNSSASQPINTNSLVVWTGECLTFVANGSDSYLSLGIDRKQLRNFARVDSSKNIKQANIFFREGEIIKITEVSQPLIDRIVKSFLKVINRLFGKPQAKRLALVYISEGMTTSEVIMTITQKEVGSIVIYEMGGRLDIKVGKIAYQVFA